MIRSISILAVLFLGLDAFGQNNVGEGRLGNGFILTKAKDLKVEGTPYLNEEFSRGKIYLQDKEPLEAYLRYDVLGEQMEVKIDKSSTDIYTFSSNRDIEYEIDYNKFFENTITVDGERISGLFQELFVGNNVKLLSKAVAQVSEPVVAKSSYEKDRPGRISISERYFIVPQDGRPQEVEMKRRSLRKTFDSRKVKEYLKNNKIKSVEDLVEFARFYDSLQ